MSFDIGKGTTIYLLDEYYLDIRKNSKRIVEILKDMGYAKREYNGEKFVILYSNTYDTQVKFYKDGGGITLYTPKIAEIDNEYMESIIDLFRVMRYKLNKVYGVLDDNHIWFVTDINTKYSADTKIKGYGIDYVYHEKDNDEGMSFLSVRLNKDCFADLREEGGNNE